MLVLRRFEQDLKRHRLQPQARGLLMHGLSHRLQIPPPPVRKMFLQMHTPVRTSQSWSLQTQHGLGVCIWMPLVNGTGDSPSLP